VKLARSYEITMDTPVVVLAGGSGERLKPLTQERSKPSVPFGGAFRIIDFTLSNCLNSGLRMIYVLIQYKSMSLERHIQLGWDSLFSPELREWIYTVSPQLRLGQRWYEGTADAVLQNLDLVMREEPRDVVIVSGDHIYKMNYRRMLDYHRSKGAVATVSAIDVPVAEAHAFGNLTVDEAFRVRSFVEKPEAPTSMPGREGVALVNMGVYVFEAAALADALNQDARRDGSRHDFGHDILPALARCGEVYAYPFVDENRKESRYWRDIGTLDAYYEASMDLVAVNPVFNLYDTEWPLRTYARQLPPAKLVFAQEEPGGRLGIALDSLICGGVIVSGGRVERSVLSPYVRVNSYARVQDSVLMDGVDIGRGARVRRAIVDKGARIAAGCVIGEDPEHDRSRFTVTPKGIVVIPKSAVVASTVQPDPVVDPVA
jgi:glucose-1-phosphate adenylyltransferase